jgi:3-hydroxyisobutyrate dehydrogenase-like beta-hydroxyacid dehydrogenase
MSEVTVIGLGHMGSALARVLQQNGCTVTVWNRSPEKAAPLLEMGAALAPSAAAAVIASPLILVCVTNYAASNRILDEVAADLAGKLLVQFTTGSPQEARASEGWAHAHPSCQPSFTIPTQNSTSVELLSPHRFYLRDFTS